MRRRILEAFGIRPDEAGRVSWLVAHSLFIGVFCAYLFSAANALFLDRFEISALPVAYILAGLVGYVAVMLFSRLERAIPFNRLLLANLFVLLVLTTAFWYLTLKTDSDWVVFFMFVWVGPSFGLILLGYWSLASRLFDLRQGKRLFGLVGSGEELATVTGLFSVPLLIGFLDGPVHLVLIASVGLVGCLAVVAAITFTYRESLGIASPGRGQAAAAERSSLGTLLKNPYFLSMAALITLLSVGHYIVDFGFLSQVRVKFQGPEQIAQFIGVFFGIIKILELVMKAFVSGRLLSQFGLSFGLIALPVLLAFCAGTAIGIGSLGLGAAHFFVAVALSKMVWAVMSTSTFLPSFRVCYQPIRGADRMSFQTHLDGTAKQLATLAVGLALLVFSSSPSFNTLNLFYGLLPILGVWIVVAVLLYRQYRARLLRNLSAEMGHEATASPVEALVKRLLEVPPEQVENAAAVLARIDAPAVVAMLLEMIARGNEESRIAALRYVEKLKVTTELDAVAEVAASDPSPGVRSVAERTVTTLHEILALADDPDRVRELASSPVPAQRGLAASAIGLAPDPRTHVGLTDLLWDKDRDVRRAALVAAGRVGDAKYWHRIISQLFSPRFSNAATFALITIGEPVLDELERAFGRADPRRRARILRIYAHISGPRAQQLLLAKLSFPDTKVRHQTLLSLSQCGYHAEGEEVAAVERQIESVVRTMAWNMAAALDLGEEEAVAEVGEALELELAEGRDELFQLLSLLYDPRAVGLVKANLSSGRPESVVYALEIMETVISPELKELVFPVFEGLTKAQALRRLDALVPRQRLGRIERLSALINREHDRVGLWARACAVRAMGRLVPEVAPDLVASLFHPQRLIQEAAARSILALDSEAYAHHRRRLPSKARERLDEVLGTDGVLAGWHSRSVLGRVHLLRDVTAFSKLSWAALVTLADTSEAKLLGPGHRLPSPRVPEDSVYVVVDGQLAFADDNRSADRSAPTHLSLLAFGPGASPVEAVTASTLIRLDTGQLYEVATEYHDLVPTLLRAGQQLDEEIEAVVEPELTREAWPDAHELGMSV